MTNNQICLLELIKIFAEYRNNIIVNIKHLQEHYQRTGIKRVRGVRNESGELLQPWLQTEYIDNAEYVGMGEFQFNRNTATINMLIKRKVRLAKSEDQTPTLEVAGLLVNNLNSFNNYTIVSDGKINIKSLQVKISSKKAFDLLKEKGVLDAEKFDFHTEYSIHLDNLPLVASDSRYSSIDGLFNQLAEIKVLTSIISAHLKKESDVFIAPQLDEFQKHYLSKNAYISFPTTNEYIDIQEALLNGTLDSRLSYKIDIGSQNILNLSKLHSANKFLNKMYRLYDKETGEIIIKPSFEMAFNENLAVRHRLLSSRTKITKVDEFMKSIFDDFLGLEQNGIVLGILNKVGADSLAQLFQDKQTGRQISKEETIAALTTANNKLEKYVENIYQDKISPLVFYIGCTGLLPEQIEAKPMTAEEAAAKYPNLQFSKNEQDGSFFAVGDSIISIYAKTEYYSKNMPILNIS
ncbi:hypothetical protein CDG77_26430 [Nostoc sp. 'Peltigera membranacea cyanobiont' 213]|uniref:hypothetical protein n=1 Tax=unclassified Nostoc TaxID=2593658 RepID=UPI000B95306D|nr:MULTISPECIES: hypothetical protein [unclassified Nostoc]AVH65720.1 hypothetical protein NPM_4175 [Nostoc sp. 'Peltigera membranacea cyanobiont' N6]OYD87984.1 hypothetical protein CDG77_26430 [Nostoc sp. 'Peltigera membranacea cyanobiont' 213]